MKNFKKLLLVLAVIAAIFVGEYLFSHNHGVLKIKVEQPKIESTERYLDSDHFQIQEAIVENAINHSEDPMESVELSPEDFVWNFLGFLKAHNYVAAAGFFEFDTMNDYFYENYQELADYKKKVSLFGDTMTRNGKLKSFKMHKFEPSNSNIQPIMVDLIYSDEVTQTISIELLKDVDSHEGKNEFYIHTSVQELLNQIQS